jgi:Leucine-rich repeat (LRR) protein
MHYAMLLQTVALTLLLTVPLSQGTCTPAITGCMCTVTADVTTGMMECKNISALPELPSNVDKVFCRDCKLGPDLNKENIPGSYSRIDTLWLHNSEILTVADNTFEVMDNLKHLNLESNKLTTLPSKAFTGLANMEWLELNYNLLENLPAELLSATTTTALIKVDLSYNVNVELPADLLDGLPITELRLEGIGLNEIPKDLLRNIKTSLTTLSLHKNTFQTLKKNSFEDVTELEFLNLDSCKIEMIEEGAFTGLSNLNRLNLGFNSLTSLDIKLFEPFHDTLKDLKIENNKIGTLDSDIINWDNIRSLLVGHNPWHCDCNLKWMKRLDLENLAKVQNLENVTCAKPDTVLGHNLHNVTEEILCDCVTCGGGKSAVALAVAIPILIVCICLIGYYLYRIMQNRRMRAMKRSGYNYSSVYKDTVEPTRAAGPV